MKKSIIVLIVIGGAIAGLALTLHFKSYRTIKLMSPQAVIKPVAPTTP